MSEVGVEPRAPKATAVGKAGGIMVASMFLSRLLGLLRDTFVVGHFGLHGLGDSWAIASKIPDLIFLLIAGGGLSSAFIPVFTELWYTNKRKEAWKVFSVVVTICSVIAFVIIALAWIFAPSIAAAVGHGQSQETIDKATGMSRIMLPAQYAFLIGSILLGTLYARKQFVAPGLAPNVYNVGIIVGASILPTLFGFGIEGVAWGALVGAYLGNILIPLVAMIPQGGSFIPSFDIHAPGVAKFFKLLLPVIVGFSLPSMVGLITQWFASRYGEGSNAVFLCSTNLMQAPNGIFGQSLALAAFPVLGQFFAEKRMDMYRTQLSRTMRTVIYLSVPTSVLMFAMAPLIVRCIYGLGSASHDPAQLAMIGRCLRIYSIGVVAWCVQPVMMRGFFSVHKTFRPIAWSTAMTALFIVLCVGAQSLQFSGHSVSALKGMGLYVLPWITNVAAILLIVILYRALEADVGKLDRLGLIRTTAKGAVSAIPVGIVAYLGGSVWTPHGQVAATVWMLLVTCVSAWIYYYITSWYKMPETEYFDRALKKMRLKR